MSNPWDVRISEAIGKALPNEMSKGSSVWQYIPYIGQVIKALGAVDSGATTYGDVYNAGKDKGLSKVEMRENALGPSIEQGVGSWMGGNDPGVYGSSGNKLDTDWSSYMGMGGNLFNSYNGGQNVDASGMFGSGMNIYDAAAGNLYGKDVYGKQGNYNSDSNNWMAAIQKMSQQNGRG